MLLVSFWTHFWKSADRKVYFSANSAVYVMKWGHHLLVAEMLKVLI